MKIFEPQGIPPAFSVFSRASAAYYRNEAGDLTLAAADVLRIQDGLPLIEPAATNTTFFSQSLSAASWSGCSRSLAAESWAGSVLFFEVAKALSSSSEAASPNNTAVTAGQTWTMTLALLAGTRNTCTVGFYGSVSQGAAGNWGAPPECSTEILSGPGVFSVYGGAFGGIWNVDNLSATEPTLVQITRQFTASMNAQPRLYPGRASSTTIGDSVKATRFQTELGPEATSYIPTAAAAVSRAADVLTPSTTDLSGGSGVAGGVLVSNADSYWPNWQALTWPAGTRRNHMGFLWEVAAGQTAANTDVPGASDKWIKVGPEPRLAAFDGEVNTRSYSHLLPASRGSSVGWAVSASAACDSIFVSDIDDASLLHVRVRSALYGAVLHDVSITPEAGQSRLRSQYLVSGLSVPAGAILEIGLSGPLNVARPGVGLIAWGSAEQLGETMYGARAGMVDYSRKEADQFGQVVLVRRAFSKTLDASVVVAKADLNRVQDRLYGLRATPVVWIFSDQAEHSVPLVVYGFYGDFYTVIDRPLNSVCSVQVKGLT